MLSIASFGWRRWRALACQGAKAGDPSTRKGAAGKSPGMIADARAAIETLIYTYAERLDLGDLVGVGQLFADSTYGPVGAEPLRGAQSVTDIMVASVQLHGGIPRTKHVTTNVIIEVAADTATARSYFTVFQACGGIDLQPIVQGRYHDEFRCCDRAWSFAARVVFMDAIGDVSRHLKFDVSDFVSGGD